MNPLPVIDAASYAEAYEATRTHPEPRFRERRPIHPDPAGTPGLPTTRRDP